MEGTRQEPGRPAGNRHHCSDHESPSADGRAEPHALRARISIASSFSRTVFESARLSGRGDRAMAGGARFGRTYRGSAIYRSSGTDAGARQNRRIVHPRTSKIHRLFPGSGTPDSLRCCLTTYGPCSMEETGADVSLHRGCSGDIRTTGQGEAQAGDDPGAHGDSLRLRFEEEARTDLLRRFT